MPEQGGKSGQSLIEACFVIFLICLIFAGLFQVSQLFAAREVLYHSANRGTRAMAVGFNHFMTTKAARVAAIPNAGRLIWPVFDNIDPTLHAAVQTLRPGELWSFAVAAVPPSAQADIEMARIPEYLAATDEWQARHTLDYSGWDALRITATAPVVGNPNSIDPIHAVVSQDYPLWVPLHRTFYAADSVAIEGESYIENHYPLYLDAQPSYW